MNPFRYLFDNTIKRSVMSSFVLVLLVPISFFAFSLFQNSWEQAQQNMLEKHQLIASTMVEPIHLFISSRQHSLKTLGEEIVAIESKQKYEHDKQVQEFQLLAGNKEHHIELTDLEKRAINLGNITKKEVLNKLNNESNHHRIQTLLDKYQRSFGDLVAISYSFNHGLNHHHTSTKKQYVNPLVLPDYSGIPLTMLSRTDDNYNSIDLVSPIFKSSISNQPVVLLKHYMLDNDGQVISALYSEISTTYITDMCSKISFGKKGHCAIVDQSGHVIAHPNKDWVNEIRDLSKLSVIKAMLDGKSGTTEFYSPFLKEDMVAGFSSISQLGWGIMIPQPKSELTKTINNLRMNTLIWLSLGILIALLVAYLLTNKITTPIRILMKRTHDISAGHDFIKLGKLPKNSPKEISQLWNSISRLLTNLQTSNKEVKKLNVSLNRDIHRATEKLRAMNKSLYEISSKDYLTSLPNRRYFTNRLEKILNKKREENIGIILIDIDKFKFINDEYGHEAGDLALQHLSDVLQNHIRKCDLVARLGGDEFVVFIRNTSDETLLKIAQKFRITIKKMPVFYRGKTIKLTLSIGTVNHVCDKSLKLEDYLGFADKAMYLSKQLGRNRVSSYKFNQEDNKERLEA